MGHTYQDVRLSGDKTKSVRMFVDSGATFSIIPPALAKELGVKTMKKRCLVSLADGRKVLMKIGSAVFRIDGREAPGTVFVNRVEEPILGVETLEALGLMVDPTTETLIPKRSWTVRLGGWRS